MTTPDATYFYSGSNHAGEIRGLSDCDEHVGVAIHELDKPGRALSELMRLADGPTVRVTANVQRNSSGKPIIMITRDRALLPEGDTTVQAAGESYTVGFRKIAANVAKRAGETANVMADLLRSMFGSGAGKSGSGHKVVIELRRVGWSITPHELAELDGSGSQVFVDSGAFSEVSFDNGWKVTKPITSEDWDTRLGAMTKIAERLGPKAYLVAPDMVGHQKETLERLERYADVVRAWRTAGANVIVPIQKGEMSQADFDTACSEMLGFSDYVRGIPSKKAAATVEEIHTLVAALPTGTRVHLLGLGPASPRYSEIMDGMPEGRPVFCDSVGIKRLVGRTNGPGGGPRVLTKIRDQIMAAWGLAGRLSFEDTYRVKAEMMKRYFARAAQPVGSQIPLFGS